MKIGLSLSFCVKDILQGKVSLDEVEFLVVGTCIEDNEEWEMAKEKYANAYWYDNKEEGKRIAQFLWENDKIHQPKLTAPKEEFYSHPQMPSWHKALRSQSALWLTIDPLRK